ncbi:hypothetical protein KO500_07880 [Cellulophaga baltica]|uniref:hypothetical protein n=1 Tax=Cellulophaga TaxID=104264 RepID=UPI001C06EA91|nr:MULTISPECIES: hypothetical protein [Cellulophaga]MBU2996349.1 hypothetical protein [Cellulophaga baltica]MDO6767745.1 hypothetical protein [Cellulophaga sp. 1_MG-2023]
MVKVQGYLQPDIKNYFTFSKNYSTKPAYFMMLFLCVVTYGYSQQKFDVVNNEYDVLQERIKKKDTLIHYITKHYECSQVLSGRIDYYYEADKLILINHLYKQGLANLWTSEDYFIIDDTLKIKTLTTEETIHLNTEYKEDERGTSSISVEKVIEVVEQRMFFDSNSTSICFARKHAKNGLDWDVAYFNSLALKESNCIEDDDEIRDKYKLLRKAEKKLKVGYSYRKQQCIFYMW